ncbi:RICIN domain-containing protein [Atopobium fossor]|uniref:RICIN domain-containing protein n=1 Tax=Atopobium fossor TaxID=39487 RepID=UPI000412A96B|nr:RICIN domain-containing protein [Atopobium fossor]
MAIKDGTYVIHSAADASYVIDVTGALDQSSTNVSLFKANYGDAQLVRVTNYDTFVVLSFVATGKALDVHNANMAAGTNVWQYDWNNTSAQKWVIESVGDKYVIRPLADASLCLAATSLSGNIQLATHVFGTALQMWTFEAKDPAPDGTYELRLKTNPDYAVDLNSSSLSDGAFVETYPRHGGNNQVLWLTNMGNGRCKLMFAHSMKYVAVDNAGNPVNGARVLQYGSIGHEGGRDNQWIFVPQGTAQINGVTVPTYQVRNYATDMGGTLCMDVQGNNPVAGGVIQMYPMNNTDAQLFALMPSEMYVQELPTPASVGLYVHGEKVTEGTILAADTYPCFVCPGKLFNGRYRYRVRHAGQSFGSFGPWKSVSDASSSYDGFGAAGHANMVFSSSDTDKKATVKLQLPEISASDIDSVEIQLEVRSFADAYNGHKGLYAHGASASSQTIRLSAKPNLQLKPCVISKDGITVAYTSDWGHGGCTVAVRSLVCDGKELLLHAITNTGVDGKSGTILVPWSEIDYAPRQGASITADVELVTDGLSTDTVATAVTTTIGTRKDPVCTTSESDHVTVLVNVKTSAASDKLSAWTRGDFASAQMTPVSQTANTQVLDAYGPLNKDGRALIVISRADGTWGVTEIVLPAITDHSYVWDWDGGHAILDLGLSAPAEMGDSTTRDYAEYATTGREYRSYRFVGGRQRDVSVTGAYVEDVPVSGSIAQLDALLEAGHATFRNWRGEVLPVAVVAVEHPAQWRSYGAVRVRQYQESR